MAESSSDKEERRDRERARARERYRTDPEYREAKLKSARERKRPPRGAEKKDVDTLRALADQVWSEKAARERDRTTRKVWGDPTDVSTLRITVPIHDYLSRQQYKTLVLIGKKPGITLKELYERIGVGKSTITHHVNCLVDLGLVEKYHESQDGRAQRLFVAGVEPRIELRRVERERAGNKKETNNDESTN